MRPVYSRKQHELTAIARYVDVSSLVPPTKVVAPYTQLLYCLSEEISMRDKRIDKQSSKIMKYNPSEIEQHWRKIWHDKQVNRTPDPQDGQQTV